MSEQLKYICIIISFESTEVLIKTLFFIFIIVLYLIHSNHRYVVIQHKRNQMRNRYVGTAIKFLARPTTTLNSSVMSKSSGNIPSGRVQSKQ